MVSCMCVAVCGAVCVAVCCSVVAVCCSVLQCAQLMNFRVYTAGLSV